MSKYQYFVGIHGEEQGPLHLEDISRLLQDGSLTRDDWVWWPGQKTWQPLWTIYPPSVDLSPEAAPTPRIKI